MRNPLNAPIALAPFLILLALLCLMAGSPPAFAADKLIDRIVATVNQNVITENQLNLAIDDVEKNQQAAGIALPDANTLRSKVLEQLINSRLELQAAQESGLTVSEADIDKAADQVAKQNNLSTDSLYQKMKAQGIDVTRWRKELHDQILIQKIQQQQVGSNITLTPEEIDSFSKSLPPPVTGPKEYHVRDFLIALPDDSSASSMANAKKLANQLGTELRQNKKIDVSHITIHDRGWQEATELPSAFSKLILTAKNNSFIGPIQTGNGFHILHLVGIRLPKGQSETLSPSEIRRKLFEHKYEKEVNKWLAELRGRATIRMYPDS